jgi:aminoglycoside 6'-N-acetyltransferase I
LLVVEGRAGLDAFAEVGVRRFADGCASSPVAYLEGIWVDPEARRSGAALALVQAAEDWARAAGYVELASDCEEGNLASEAFHHAAGFEEVQRSVCFRRDLTP